MPSLYEAQREMARRLANRQASEVAETMFAADPARIDRGLAVYRANSNAAAVKALAAAYPVVSQVVGIEFFEALAREYRRTRPSTSGDLNEYGAEFAAFLDGFPPVDHLPYLPDLARLEWRVHEAEGAADAQAWDAAALGRVDVERQDAIRLAWAPGIAIVESRFPIARLRVIHQPGYAGEFAVDWTIPERALVAREGLAVTVRALDDGEAAFFLAALGGSALGDAATAALSIDPAFDLGRLLAGAIASHLVCGFTLEGPSE